MQSIVRREFLKRSLGVMGAVVAYGVPLARPAGASEAGDGPILVTAQGLGDSTVQLLWTAVAGASSYLVHRDGALLRSSAGTLVVDTMLAASTTHQYEVSAVVGGIETARTPVVVSTQAPENRVPPSRPGTIKVSGTTSKGATLRWTGSTDDEGVLGYRILRGAEGDTLAQLVQIATTDGAVFYTATGLKAGTGYRFAVLAVDAGGNLSPAREVVVRTKTWSESTPPNPPSSSSVAANAFSDSRIDLVWGPSSSSDTVAYEIFRDGVIIAEVASPMRRNYSDNGLAPESSHRYQIRAVDGTGNASPLTTARTVKTLTSGTVRITRGPYLQAATPTSIRIAWFTNIAAGSTVAYGIGGLTNTLVDPVPTVRHVMQLGDLTPGTSYSYRATSGAASVLATFRTPAAPGQTFTFAAVGDFGGGSAQATTLAGKIAALGCDFVQTLGDNVYPDSQDPDPATTYSDYDARLYKPYRTVLQRQSFWVANGNKEYYGDGAIFANFWMPNNRRWYGYDWGDAHVLVLDTDQPFAPGSPQYQYAAEDLAASQGSRWRILVVHRPPYSSTSANSSAEKVRDELVPLAEAHGVHLVLSGNSHNYERSHPLLGGVAQSEGGVVYVVSGGGGNGLNQFTVDAPSWSAFRLATYQFLAVTVSPTSLEVRGIDQHGAVFDSVTLGS